jgi:hypothetical protein
MSDIDDNQHDDGLLPSMDQTSPSSRFEPGITDKEMDVPEELVNAGQPTNGPEDDSPESLDEEITQGANREDIDPDHSYDRPAIDNIDEEENGVS